MNKEPISNDPNDPLISIFIYNYNGQYLRQCLDSIFHQNILTNFEVILIDDATNNGSWETALEFAANYKNIITISRNRINRGPEHNLKNCNKMAKGRYGTSLTGDQAFLPDYIKRCVNTLSSDPYAIFSLVFRIEKKKNLPPSISNMPLVSIACYNYNYGRYLRQCLESVFAQTYQNIELCFSDNASTDESWEIALEFAQKYPKKMYLTRNRKNFGTDDNFANTRMNMQGKYFVNFCSDDAFEPDFVEKCVTLMELNPNVGHVIVNREIINEKGERTSEPPFYNQSCIIPGEKQAAVYMMAGINPSVSQIMYRRDVVDTRSATGSLIARYYGTRIMDFNISLDFDIGYINKPLLLHRVHSQSDTQQSDSKLLPIMGMYVLNHQLSDIASIRNLNNVTCRLPDSISKLSLLSVRYCVRSLIEMDEEMALRYFYLAKAIDSQVADDAVWKQINEYWDCVPEKKQLILEKLSSQDNLLTRTISYAPPVGSIEFSFD